MFAILTKTLPITATKPMRIKAYTPDHSVTIPWPMDTQSDREAHFAAVAAFANKYVLRGEWAITNGGEIKGGYAFVAGE